MGPRGATVYVVAALTAATLVGCSSGSQPHTQTPATASTLPVATTSAAMTSSASVDPGAQPALDAYLNFTAAVNNAERKPRKLGQAIDPAADYAKYSFDPARQQEDSYFLYLAQKGLVRRGTPPTPHPQVATVNLGAKPYPTVVLTNCASPSPGWEQTYYDVKTGKAVPDPYATQSRLTLSIQVIYFEKHWGVYKIDRVAGQPCAG